MSTIPRRTFFARAAGVAAALGLSRHAAAGPATLAMQPRPLVARVSYIRVGWWWCRATSTRGAIATAIMRQWRPGDSGPGGRCRLCDTCVAYEDGCLIQVAGYVPREAAPLLSSVGRSWQAVVPGPDEVVNSEGGA